MYPLCLSEGGACGTLWVHRHSAAAAAAACCHLTCLSCWCSQAPIPIVTRLTSTVALLHTALPFQSEAHAAERFSPLFLTSHAAAALHLGWQRREGGCQGHGPTQHSVVPGEPVRARGGLLNPCIACIAFILSYCLLRPCTGLVACAGSHQATGYTTHCCGRT